MLRMADGSEWLRGGVLFSPADYPVLAKVAAGRVFGRLVGFAPATSTPTTQPARIGSVVVAGRSLPGVVRSADGGKTWAELNAGGYFFLSIVAVGGVFRALAVNDFAQTVMRALSSVDGINWAQSGTVDIGVPVAKAAGVAVGTGAIFAAAKTGNATAVLRVDGAGAISVRSNGVLNTATQNLTDIQVVASGQALGVFTFAYGNTDSTPAGGVSNDGGATWAQAAGITQSQMYSGGAAFAGGSLLHFAGGRLNVHKDMVGAPTVSVASDGLPTPVYFSWGYRLFDTPAGALLVSPAENMGVLLDSNGRVTTALGMLPVIPQFSMLTRTAAGIAFFSSQGAGAGYYESDLVNPDYVGQPTAQMAANGNASSYWVNYIKGK